MYKKSKPITVASDLNEFITPTFPPVTADSRVITIIEIPAGVLGSHLGQTNDPLLIKPRIAAVTGVTEQTYPSATGEKRLALSASFVDNEVLGFHFNLNSSQRISEVSEAVKGEVLNKLKTIRHNHKRLAKIGKVTVSTGGDPEFFMEDELGAIIPAFRFLPEKANGLGFPYKGGTGNHAMQNLYWDGLQLEYTIFAGSCHEERVASFRCGMEAALTAARKICPGAKLSSKTLIEVDDEFLASTDEKYLEFGCAPSYNAYNLPNKLGDGKTAKYRSTGGHIHFGLNNTKTSDGKYFVYHDMDKVISAVKWLDHIMGIAMIPMFENYDNPIRRQFYGLPGEYRLPLYGADPYKIPGIEWRTPSNAYLFHPTTTNLVLDMARAAINFSFVEKLSDSWRGDEKEVTDAIIACDVKKARELMDRNKDLYLLVAKKAYPGHTGEAQEATFNAFYKGVESIIKEHSNIHKNWGLDNKNYWNSKEWSGCWWRNQVYDVLEGKLCE